MVLNFNHFYTTTTDLTFGLIQFLDLLCLVVQSSDFIFFGLVLLLLLSFILTTTKSLIYQVINLSLMSLIVVALWIYYIGNNVVLMAYILAFVGAVVMLFLSVIMMLPTSVIAARPQVNFVLLFPFVFVFKMLSVIFEDANGPLGVFIWAWGVELLIFTIGFFFILYIVHKDITGKNLFDAVPFFYKHYCSTKNKNFPINVFTFGKYIIGAYNPMFLTQNLSELNSELSSAIKTPHNTYMTITNYVSFNTACGFSNDAPELIWLLRYDSFVTSLAYRMRALVDWCPLVFYSFNNDNLMDEDTFNKKYKTRNDYHKEYDKEFPEYYVATRLLHQIKVTNPFSVTLFQMEDVHDYELNPELNEHYQRYFLSTDIFWLLYYALFVILSYSYQWLMEQFTYRYYFNWSAFFDVNSQTATILLIYLSAVNVFTLEKNNIGQFLHGIIRLLTSNNEGIVEIKDILYESNPPLIVVPVIVLLVALLGAAILSRKSK